MLNAYVVFGLVYHSNSILILKSLNSYLISHITPLFLTQLTLQFIWVKIPFRFHHKNSTLTPTCGAHKLNWVKLLIKFNYKISCNFRLQLIIFLLEVNFDKSIIGLYLLLIFSIFAKFLEN